MSDQETKLFLINIVNFLVLRRSSMQLVQSTSVYVSILVKADGANNMPCAFVLKNISRDNIPIILSLVLAKDDNYWSGFWFGRKL